MLKLICSVRDVVANVYSNPFTSHNQGTALRDFASACRDPESQLSKSPDGYMLYSLGTFDDDTGAIRPHDPALLANATQFISE
jgi:hypothetical protein